MAIDANIIGRLQPVQAPDQMNMLARVMAIKDAQTAGQMRDMQMAEMQRGINETNALNTAYKDALGADGAVDRNRLYSTLANQNLGSRIPALQKTFLEADKAGADLKKTQVETQKAELEAGLKKAEHAASLFSLARDPQSYGVVRAMVKQQFGQDLPEQFDPMFVQAQIAAGQTITQRLAAEHQRLTLAETGRHNVATERNQAGQLAVSQGNLAETRRHNSQMEGFRGQEVNAPRGQFIETTNGYVLGDPKTGKTSPVMGPDGQPLRGKAADRSLNETQAKANLFGSRMKEADRILSEMEGKYSPMAVDAKIGADRLPVIGGIAGAAGNAMLSAEGQQAEQAQRDFINAVLRRESGAAIAQSEFDNARKQYFPEPRDTPEKLAQKRRNRQMAIAGLEAEVPGGFRGAPTLTSNGQGGGSGGRVASGKVGDASAPQIIDFGSLK